MFPEAILKPVGDKWQVVIVDDDSEITWTFPLGLEEAQKEAFEYNRRTLIVHEGLRKLRESKPSY
jgi:hypothetical protein